MELGANSGVFAGGLAVSRAGLVQVLRQRSADARVTAFGVSTNCCYFPSIHVARPAGDVAAFEQQRGADTKCSKGREGSQEASCQGQPQVNCHVNASARHGNDQAQYRAAAEVYEERTIGKHCPPADGEPGVETYRATAPKNPPIPIRS